MNKLIIGMVLAMTVQCDGLDTSFKAYEDYKYITNTESLQYKLQQQAWTDENGLRRYGDEYMVAVGSYYGDVGDHIVVTLDTETTLECIIGDSKGKRYYHPCGKGANVVEFIVDTNFLDSTARKMGDCSYIDGLDGQVLTIENISLDDEDDTQKLAKSAEKYCQDNKNRQIFYC